MGPLTALEALRQQISQPFFMEIIILISWSIWTSHDNFIFKNEDFSIEGAKPYFTRESAITTTEWVFHF